MKNYNTKYRLLLIGILFILLLLVIAMTWYFTSQNGQVSHATSMAIAKKIENFLLENYPINQSHYFSRVSLDDLVRKAAHFSEYILLGSITSTLFNVIFRRVWMALASSIALCSLYAYIDEYRQNFFPGRTPTWFDWRVDVSGAILGILIAAIIYLVFRYIYKLRARINELEDQKINQP